MNNFSPVYGPVRSWRYGNSLGIDPIGMVSSCSFNCVYCQLGAIEHLSLQRQVFIPTGAILTAIEARIKEPLDVITVSGSGEPTLALNLGEIIAGVKDITAIPLVVLTNGTLLGVPAVRQDLALADEVSVKLDGITTQRLKQINRPISIWEGEHLWENLQNFRQEYHGKLTIQTMILAPWSEAEEQLYIDRVKALQPQHIYLNHPRRPKPKGRLIAGRENLTTIEHGSWFQPIGRDYLGRFAQAIRQEAHLTVSYVIQQE